ncbi:MAG: hypothetical protein JW818_04630 [Pirellulales bacterium]|nr:hypothetical protein [Pirellulales bacterium]
MEKELINEYLINAEAAALVDYADKASVQRFNSLTDRMRAIVDEAVTLGQDAVTEFALLLDKEPAATWAAHHLVEKADIDAETLARCFARVELAILEAESKGDVANAMGERMWLKEWKARSNHSRPGNQ